MIRLVRKKRRTKMKKADWFGKPSKKKKSFLFTPVKLPTKKSVRKIKKRNLTWPQAQVRFPKIKMFGDSDGDGKLNMFDCKPFDKKKHGWIRQGPNKGKYKVHSLRPYKEAYQKKVHPADTQGNMSSGRDSGYFGTGIYGFKTKKLAQKNQTKPKDIEDDGMVWASQSHRVLKSYVIEKPLILDKDQSKNLHYQSKKLNQAYHSKLNEYDYDNDKKIILSARDKEWKRIVLADRLSEATGVDVTSDDVKKAIRKKKGGWEKEYSQDQPITRLLKDKGYGGVIPHDDYQNFGYGSVVHIDPEGIEPQPNTEKERLEKEELRKKLRKGEDYRKERDEKEAMTKIPEIVALNHQDGTQEIWSPDDKDLELYQALSSLEEDGFDESAIIDNSEEAVAERKAERDEERERDEL